MGDKKLSLEELADTVNSKLDVGSIDARYSSVVSPRRIRDYVSKGLLDKPYGVGRDKWYGDEHVEKLLTLRRLQSDGISEQALKKLSSPSISNETDLKTNALNFLSDVQSRGYLSEPSSVALVGNTLMSNNNVESASAIELTDSILTKSVNTLSRQINRSWSEYQLDAEGKFFLRVESGAKVKNGEEVLKQIKSILDIKGDENA